MGGMRSMQVINDCVYVCIRRVYSHVFKKYTSHSFIYDSYFSKLDNSEGCGAIIDNRSYAPFCVLEEKYRTRKTALKNVLRIFFEGSILLIMHSKLL